MLALHNECLTRRYLLGRLNILEGLLCFGLGVLSALEGLRKLGVLRLGVTLQGLEFFDEVLELLLDLIYPSLLLVALGAPLGRLVFSLGQRFLKGRHFGRGSYYIHDAYISVNHFSFI